ncbi:hypothetical protein DACRYDRAFT_21031 [Dacryopinax primogenitus]|uniref:CRAL-TRIO domain-containing protein n=1 Tax=Dacryopinax primogenitus (strain DJM 731) TaxID=1858805 RepID=M5G2S4_DACPD|nr:uncharacterized protein DACRYDRAFT_21031 [Dacryopinax primogenitus]EJU04526.1 hypothetical protein DACRYDRAFT_21031 [Dacryopinax primogenitus]
MADARLTLTHKSQALEILRTTHQASISELQIEALDDLIPTLQEELALDEKWREWAEAYVEDDGTLFRMHRKHGFSKSSTFSALRNALLLPPPRAELSEPHPSVTLTISPPDPPTLHICLTYLTHTSLHSFKQTLLFCYEKLRLYLLEHEQLGFYCVLDLGGARIRDILSDIVPWYTTDLQPRYPSMCAATFIINYTWMYGGLWSVFRRIAPAQALSRIFFVTMEDLEMYFPACLAPPEPLSPVYSYPSLSHVSWEERPHSPIHFSVLEHPPPQRTRWKLFMTLTRMLGERMRSARWWKRWRWFGWILLLLVVRWWFTRRRPRRPVPR